MSPGFLCRIMRLSLLLHSRVLNQDSTELPKKLSTLSAELRLRQVPGKSVERSPRLRRLDVFIAIERQQSSRPRIVGVSLPPLGLLGALALGLALSLRARALARADPSIRSKPLSAETTRARPVRHSSAGTQTDPTTILPTLDAQVAAATFTSAALRATLDGSVLQSDLGPFFLSAQASARVTPALSSFEIAWPTCCAQVKSNSASTSSSRALTRQRLQTNSKRSATWSATTARIRSA